MHGPTRPRSRGSCQNFIDFGLKEESLVSSGKKDFHYKVLKTGKMFSERY